MTDTVLTRASGEVTGSRSSWMAAQFCIKLREKMVKTFDEAYPDLAATAALR